MEELRSRKVIRSSNNPVADYTELLVSSVLGLSLLGRSAAGYDATDVSGVRYQIKGRRITTHNKSTRLSAIRNLDSRPFDILAAVIYTSNFEIDYAALIPIEMIAELSGFSKHINGSFFHFRRSVLNDPRVTNITSKLVANSN
jgi:hypothetical protein